MVQNDNLGKEVSGILGWIVLGVGSDVTSLKILDGQVLNVETNVITWLGFGEGLVMHFDGFALSSDVHWGEGDDHAWLDDTGLNSADWNSSNTTDLVDVL